MLPSSVFMNLGKTERWDGTPPRELLPGASATSGTEALRWGQASVVPYCSQ